MSNLLLIAGLHKGISVRELHSRLEKKLLHRTVKELWIDPCTESRAVAFFDQPCDLNEVVIWKDACLNESIWINTAKPTSVLVKVKNIRKENVKEELLNICTSVTGGMNQVANIQPVNDDSEHFEISFNNGWETVLFVCSRKWDYGSAEFTVVPYFECFKEDPEKQLQQLKDRYHEDKSHKDSRDLLQQTSDFASTKSSDEQHCRVKEDNTSAEMYENAKSGTSQNWAEIRLRYPHISMLLHFLNFKHAAEKQYDVTVHEQESRIKIEGCFTKVTKLQNMLDCEDQPTHPQFEEELLTSQTFQQYLRKFISSDGYHVDLVDTDDKIQLQVTSKLARMNFQEFVSELVKSYLEKVQECPGEETAKLGKNSKPKTASLLQCHPLLLCILNSLNLKEVLRNAKQPLTLDIDEKDRSVTLGPYDAVQTMLSILSTCTKEMQDADQWEEFVSNTDILNEIHSYLKRCQIILDENSEICVKDHLEDKVPLKTFICSFVKVEKFLPLPMQFQVNEKWQDLIKNANKKLHHIICTNDNVFLFKMGARNESIDSALIQNIHKTISSLTSTGSSNLAEKNLLARSGQNKSEIHYPDDKERHVQQQQITKHFSCTRHFVFPGLLSYLESEGSDLIKNLSEKHNCIIEFPSRTISHDEKNPVHNQQQSKNSAGLQHKVIMLLTAKYEKTKVHVIQGNMDDMNLRDSCMKIELQPSEKAIICTAEDCGPKKIIYLPPWKASSSHFEKLRKTFLESLSHILNEPKVKKYATVCISTAKFQDERTDHPFPCDVIAKILLEHLLDAHCDTDSEFNIYICEPENEAVFKAFHFFLKLKWSLQHSDKDSMERICFKEQYHFPDKKHKGVSVQTTANTPQSVVFEDKLQKRHPESENKSNHVKPLKWKKVTTDTDHTGAKPKKLVAVESEIPETELIFMSMDEYSIEKAYDELQKKLLELMNENSQKIELTREQTELFENTTKDIQQDTCVAITWQKFYEVVGDGQIKVVKKKKKQKKTFLQPTTKIQEVLTNSIITICGLTRDNVSQFAGAMFGSSQGTNYDHSEAGAHAM